MLQRRWFSLILIILLIPFSYSLFVSHAAAHVLIDFRVYYESARRLSAGFNIYNHIYDVVAEDGRTFRLYYFYPPFLAWALSAFISLGYESLVRLWCMLSFSCVLVSVVCWASLLNSGRWATIPWLSRVALVLFFLICFEPLYWGIREGQVNAIILALLSLHLWLQRKKRFYESGGMIALAAMIKMSPVVLLASALRFREWRILTGFAWTVLIACTGLFMTTVPTEVYRDFFLPFGPLFAGTLERHYVFNFATDRVLLGLVGLDSFVLLRWAVKCMLVGLAAIFLFNVDERRTLSKLRTGAAVIVFMMLLAPTMWGHHLVWAFIPLAVLSLRTFKSAQMNSRHLVQVLGLFVVIGQTMLIHLSVWNAFPALSRVTAALPTLALGMLLFMLWRWERAEQPQ